MPIRTPIVPATLAAALAVALLAGCATQQENPIYQYSSVYDQKHAGMQAQDVAYRDLPPSHATLPAPVSTPAPVYSRVAPDCVALGDCAPVGVAETQGPTVSEPWASPTEERFAGGATTPGFRAVEGSLTGDAEPAPAPAPSFEAERPADLPYSSPAERIEDIPTLTISGPIHTASSLSGTQSHALMHRVVTGDTVYSLSRTYCADIDAIRAMNGLDAGYSIALGQDLKLPANCQ